MKNFIRDIIKETVVTVLSTMMLSTTTYYGFDFVRDHFELSISPRIVLIFIGLIIFLGLTNLVRIVRKKKIDYLQEYYFSPVNIPEPDAKLTLRNNCELYQVDLLENSRSYTNLFENDEPTYTIINIHGPLCAECELELKQKRLFWGKYKHFCPREHVSFVNKFTNHTMSEHLKVDVAKDIRDNGLNDYKS